MQNLKVVSGQKTDDSENLGRIDFNIWVALIFLCCFGLIMVLSASSYECASSETYHYDSMYFFKRQALFIITGFAGILVLRHYDYRRLQSLAVLGWIVAVICIFLLRTPLGISVNGAKRWLGIGAARFQVAEVVKIAVILFLADMVTKYSRHLGKVQLTFYLWLAGGIPAVLLFFISNDLSSSIIVLGITFGISFICTRTIKMHLTVIAGAIAFLVYYVNKIANNLPTAEELEYASFRVGRIAAWLAPERYSDNQGYQTLQALYAIGNGGLLGKSLGNSTQKLYAIPEAHTDMIFSIVCEELGLIGATLLISLFLYLLYQLLRLALSSRDLFASVIVLGIFLHIATQTVINLAVNVNLFPNTGLTLPFISYGGTSVLLLLMEMSIVFSIIQIRMNKMTWTKLILQRLKQTLPVRIMAAIGRAVAGMFVKLIRFLTFQDTAPQKRRKKPYRSARQPVSGRTTASTRSGRQPAARSAGSYRSGRQTVSGRSGVRNTSAARSASARTAQTRSGRIQSTRRSASRTYRPSSPDARTRRRRSD